MRAKYYLIALLFLFMGTRLLAQFKKDHSAPVNKIALKYHKDHFGLKGPIGEYNDGYTTYHFDRDGYLVKDRSALGLSQSYEYRGEQLDKINSALLGSSTIVYKVIVDPSGRVLRKATENGTGNVYVYDLQGNLLEEREAKDMELKYRYQYDSKNRLVRTDGYYNAIDETSLNTYTYSKDGGYVVVTTSYSSSNPKNKSKTYSSYYKDSNYYGRSKSHQGKTDQHGNPTTYINEDGTQSTSKTYRYWGEGYTGPSGAAVSTPASPNTNTPQTTKKTGGCEYGDCYNGWGKKTFDSGYYIGFWQNGRRHGYGMFQWDGSGKYMGFWTDDDLDGYGCYLGTDKNMIGQYVDGSMHGLGYTHDLNDDVWERGRFDNYLLAEEHTFYTNNVDTGCIAGDCQNRYGRYKWSNGDTFTGFFKDGKMYMGTYNFASGSKYEGMFNSNNQFHGEGRFWFPDDAYYGGQWQNGQYHGRGYYHDKDAVTTIGEWSNGNFVRKLD